MAQLGEYLGSPGFTPPPFPYEPTYPTPNTSSFPPNAPNFEAGPSNFPKSGPSLLDIIEAVDALDGKDEEEEGVKIVDDGVEVEHGFGEQDDIMNSEAWKENVDDDALVGEEENDDTTHLDGVVGAIIESLGVEIEPLERVDASERRVDVPITPTTPISPLTPHGDSFILCSRAHPSEAIPMVAPVRLQEVGGSGSVIKKRRLVKKSKKDDDARDVWLVEDEDIVPSSKKPKKPSSKPLANRTRSTSSSLKTSFDFICDT